MKKKQLIYVFMCILFITGCNVNNKKSMEERELMNLEIKQYQFVKIKIYDGSTIQGKCLDICKNTKNELFISLDGCSNLINIKEIAIIDLFCSICKNFTNNRCPQCKNTYCCFEKCEKQGRPCINTITNKLKINALHFEDKSEELQIQKEFLLSGYTKKHFYKELPTDIQKAIIKYISLGLHKIAILNSLGTPRTIKVTPNGKYIIYISEGKKNISICDARTGKFERILQSNETKDLKISPEGDKLFLLEKKSGIKIWHIKSGKCEKSIFDKSFFGRKESNKLCFDISKDMKKIVLASCLGIKIFNIKKNNWDKILCSESNSAYCITYNDKKIIYIGENHTFTIWDISSGKSEKIPFSYPSLKTKLINSPDGRYIIFGNEILKIWDLEKRIYLKKFLDLEYDEILDLKFSPDEKSLICLSYNRLIIMNWKTKKIIEDIDVFVLAPKCLDISSDGKIFLGSEDERIYVFWE